MANGDRVTIAFSTEDRRILDRIARALEKANKTDLVINYADNLPLDAFKKPIDHVGTQPSTGAGVMDWDVDNNLPVYVRDLARAGYKIVEAKD